MITGILRIQDKNTENKTRCANLKKNLHEGGSAGCSYRFPFSCSPRYFLGFSLASQLQAVAFD